MMEREKFTARSTIKIGKHKYAAIIHRKCGLLGMRSLRNNINASGKYDPT